MKSIKPFLRILLSVSLILPSTTQAQEALVPNNNLLARVTNFIANYHLKQAELQAIESENGATVSDIDVPSPTVFSQELKKWEQEALIGVLPKDSAQLLESVRTRQLNDRALEREADKIVADIFKPLWLRVAGRGVSPEEFHATLLELFTLYVQHPDNRAPLEMIFSRMDSYHFTDAEKNEIEKNKTFLGNLDTGVMVMTLLSGAYFAAAPAKQKAAMIAALDKPGTTLLAKVKLLIEAMRNKVTTATAQTGSIPRSRALVVPSQLYPKQVAEFRRQYRRDPRNEQELADFIAYRRMSIYFNETVRVPSARRQVGKQALVAFNQLKTRLLGDILKLSFVQQLGVSMKFMGINAVAGSAWAAIAKEYFKGNHRQYTIVPEDEMNQFIRPLAVLDLTCRAEELNAAVLNELSTGTKENREAHINTFKALVDEYRFLLRAASVYSNEIEEALPLPAPVSSDAATGNILFTKTYEGTPTSIEVACPTRQGNPFKVITLKEAKPILDETRDFLLIQEIVDDLEGMNKTKANAVAKKILSFSAKSHNAVVDFISVFAKQNDPAAKLLLSELKALMKNANPNSVSDLGARTVPQ